MRRLALVSGGASRRTLWTWAVILAVFSLGAVLAAAGCDRTRPYQASGEPTARAPQAPAAAAPGTPAPAAAAASATQGPVKTAEGWKFTFHSPGANSVALAGSFNSWSTSADMLKKGKGGVWEIVKPLAAGTYQYKFVVNGTDWKEDPNNPKSTDDGYGGKNSVLVVP